jgi:hypothetical protein
MRGAFGLVELTLGPEFFVVHDLAGWEGRGGTARRLGALVAADNG